jgi:hypothetical protein
MTLHKQLKNQNQTLKIKKVYQEVNSFLMLYQRVKQR